VAAAVVILGGLGYFIFQVSTGNKNNEVAVKLEEKKSKAPASTITADSNRSTTVESTSVVGTNKQVETTTKPNPEKKKTVTPDLNAEANKDDQVVEITKPSQPALNDKEQTDSARVDRSLGVKAPAAMEKRSVVADNKQIEASAYFKKEDASNNRQQANYFNGRIKDANNNPLPFANITNTRDNVGTYADAQGRFTLVSPIRSLMYRFVPWVLKIVQCS
jgi:hypothetical protein